MRSRFSTICRQFTAVAAEAAGDADLLARFAATRDDAAFALLVKRHGPMVWSVCRNLLANAADADDAFQATFLALVRGSKSVRKPEALGAWLHGVAVRVAQKLKRSAARRTNREKKVANGEASSPVADSRWDELLAAVHEEVAKLPDGERTAFVVCCLEGVRQPDAIAQLGWKPGTLTGRLSKAKQRLLDRLTQRGLAPAAALGVLGLGSTTGQATVPAPLVATVTNFAANAGSIPASLLELTQGVTEMTISKVKMLAAAVLVAGGLAVGGGAGWFANADAQSAPPPPTPRAVPAGAAAPLAPPMPGAFPSGPPAAVPGGGGLTGGAAAPSAGATPAQAMARSPSALVWEYKFVDVSALNREELKTVLEKEDNAGWELATIDQVSLPRQGTERTAIMKRQKFSGGAMSSGMGIMGASSPAMAPAGGASMFPPSGIAGLGGGATSPVPAKSVGGDLLIDRPTNLPAPTINNTTVRLPTPSRNPIPIPEEPTAAAAKFTLQTITLRAATSTNVAKVLKELIAINEFHGEVTAAIADEDSNSILVKATDNGRKAVADRVKQLDDAAAKRNEDGVRSGRPKP